MAAECNECVCCLISRMVSLLAVVLSMANVVSSVDLYEQVTPRHFESPKNLVSKDISVLPRLPRTGYCHLGYNTR